MAPKDTALNEAISVLEKQLFDEYPPSEKIYNTIQSIKTFITPVNKAVNIVDTPTGNGEINNDVLIALVFDKETTVTDLVKFALLYLNKLSKVKDIENVIRKFYPAFDKGLSTPIYKLKESGTIDTYNPTGSNHKAYYGMKEWFIGENKVKDVYLTEELEFDNI